MNEPLVMLPGMMCDARLFWPQILELGSARTVSVVPSTGASSIGALAARVLEDSPRRFALAGGGIGGIVAMEVVRRAPERVTRLALLDTSPLPETPQAAAAREPHIVAARAGRLSGVVREEIGPSWLAPGQGRASALATLVAMAEALGPEVFIAQSRALQRRPDQQKTLRTMKVPTLVLCGERDGIYPVKRHEFMAELIPNAMLEVVPDAGHLPTIEAPQATNAALRHWLEAPLVLR